MRTNVYTDLSDDNKLIDEFSEMVFGRQQVHTRPDVFDEAAPCDDRKRAEDPTPVVQDGDHRLQQADFAWQKLYRGSKDL
jgi:hypothetical protein